LRSWVKLSCTKSCGAPDPRWSDDELHTLGQVKGSDFKVVKMENITAP
jgi:hypothetical protein